MTYHRGMGLTVPLTTAIPSPSPTASPLIGAPRISAGVPSVSAPVIASRAAPITSPAYASFVEPECVDYHYAPVGGIPEVVPRGSVIVFVLPAIRSLDSVPAGSARLFGRSGSAADSRSTMPTVVRDPRFADNAISLSWGDNSITSGPSAGLAVWLAIRTTRELTGGAAALRQYVNAALQANASRLSWQGLRGLPPIAINGLAPGESPADIQVGVLNALGAINEFAAAFNIMFTVVGLPAAAARPLQAFTTPASILEQGVRQLTEGPALAASVPTMARTIVSTGNAQVDVPDADVGQVTRYVESELGALRARVNSAISALHAAMAVTMPPVSGLNSAIAEMRAAVQAALLSSNTQLRDVSPGLRRYAQCQGEKAAEPAAQTAINNARASIDYVTANLGAQAAMPAVITQLQAALAQIDVISREFNVPKYRRHFLGLPIWLWAVGGATLIVGGAVATRVIRSRRRAAAAKVTANRRVRRREARKAA